MTLHTFGYEGLTIKRFISRLKASGVATIIDVRELPLSRKPGFSKRSFAEHLSAAGIAYAHMPTLGCPKPIRDRYKVDGDWSKYEKAFSAYLQTRLAEVKELAEIAKSTDACLVCFEADFTRCHRRIVGQAAASKGQMRLAHITAKTVIPETPLRRVA